MGKVTMAERGIYLWRGVVYVGAAAVAEAAGRSVWTVHWHLREYGNLDRLGEGRWPKDRSK